MCWCQEADSGRWSTVEVVEIAGEFVKELLPSANVAVLGIVYPPMSASSAAAPNWSSSRPAKAACASSRRTNWR
jgi:hypothetical protein